MGSNNIGVRASFALQATQASMAQVVYPLDLSGAWGPFDRPKAVNEDAHVSRIAVLRIRLLGKPYEAINSVSDVFDTAEGLTTTTYLILQGADYALRFGCRIGEDGKIQAKSEKRYGNFEIALCELDAADIVRCPQFEYFAAFHPASAVVLRTGLDANGYVVLAAAVKDFQEFDKRHLRQT